MCSGRRLLYDAQSTSETTQRRMSSSWPMSRRYPEIRSWLRHCATNRQVAGSIHDGVGGFFHWHTPVGRTMAPGSTQPLTEMSTRNISWGGGGGGGNAAGGLG
jgi:hypothetical protein